MKPNNVGLISIGSPGLTSLSLSLSNADHPSKNRRPASRLSDRYLPQAGPKLTTFSFSSNRRRSVPFGRSQSLLFDSQYGISRSLPSPNCCYPRRNPATCSDSEHPAGPASPAAPRFPDHAPRFDPRRRCPAQSRGPPRGYPRHSGQPGKGSGGQGCRHHRRPRCLFWGLLLDAYPLLHQPPRDQGFRPCCCCFCKRCFCVSLS